MTWFRSAATALLPAAACGLVACTPDPVALRWSLVFDDPSLKLRVTALEAQIRSGGCASSDVVYRERFAPEDTPPAPSALREGRYGFFARALDGECWWYASGCRTVTLPGEDGARLTVHLAAAAAPERLLGCDGALDGGEDAAPDAASDGAILQIDTVSLEAEDANPLLPPFQVLTDDTASGGKYIVNPYDSATGKPITDFKRNDAPALDADGLATYDFDVRVTGRYRLWARAVTPTLDEDSFWFKLDDRPWILWNDIAHTDTWQWFDVRDFASRFQTLVLDLDAGPHRLVVSYRELNAKLDRLLFTTDLLATPTD